MKKTLRDQTREEITVEKTPTIGSIFLRATLLSFLFTSIMLFITFLGIATWGFIKINKFSKLTNTPISEFKNIIKSGLNTSVTQTNNRKNILILGLDSLDTRKNSPALTDTIMIVSLNLDSGKISTISLPRDIWSNDYLTKINALYFYGQKKYPSEPERFTKEVVEDLTGVSIHHTIILSMDSVAQIIDILGGIEVDVKESFVDHEFPREDVDVTKVSDPKKLYKTVSFTAGKQVMNSQKVLEYMRSRKSDNDQGDDLARSYRQQIVIDSLIQKLKNLNPLKDEEVIAKLYNYYNKNFSKQFSIQEGVATIKALYKVRNNITLSNETISVYPDDKNGVITNPPIYKYNNQWVYEIRNRDNFKNEVLSKLDLEQ